MERWLLILLLISVGCGSDKKNTRSEDIFYISTKDDGNLVKQTDEEISFEFTAHLKRHAEQELIWTQLQGQFTELNDCHTAFEEPSFSRIVLDGDGGYWFSTWSITAKRLAGNPAHCDVKLQFLVTKDGKNSTFQRSLRLSLPN